MLVSKVTSIGTLETKNHQAKDCTLKVLFNYLEYENRILVNPLRKIKIKIKEPIMLPKAMTSEESSTTLGHIYNLITQTEKGTYSYLEASRNAVVVELLFAAGARVSEIADLRLDCVLVH